MLLREKKKVRSVCVKMRAHKCGVSTESISTTDPCHGRSCLRLGPYFRQQLDPRPIPISVDNLCLTVADTMFLDRCFTVVIIIGCLSTRASVPLSHKLLRAQAADTQEKSRDVFCVKHSSFFFSVAPMFSQGSGVPRTWPLAIGLVRLLV